MKPKGKLVARYESRSSPGIIYDVREDAAGNLSCNCPAWIYKAGGRRSCRHVEDAARKAYVGPFEVTDIPSYDEALRMEADPEEKQRWLEEHLKPRAL